MAQGITERLTKDHEELQRLLMEAKDAHADQRAGKFEALHTELVAHERAEEVAFYSTLEDEREVRDMVLEGFYEHRLLDVIQEDLLATAEGSDEWDARMEVLDEQVSHHIEDEEGELFPKVKDMLGQDRLEEMREEFDRLKEERLKQSQAA